MSSNSYKIAALLALIAAFLYGLFALVKIRFEQGNAYPAYSSFRADPQGTKALYESFQKLPDVTVSRNFKSWRRLDMKKDTTFVLLGLKHAAVEYIAGIEDKSLLDRIAEGNRLILATVADSKSVEVPEFLLELDKRLEEKESEDAESENDASTDTSEEEVDETEQKKAEEEDKTGKDKVWRSKQLAVDFDTTTTLGTEALAYANVGLPDRIPWRPSRKLVEYDDKWRIIYQVKDSPVILERPYGRGTIVLLTDSYLLSNEALLKERQSELIAWLMQKPKHIVINESHLGVVEPRGIATLMREYKLGGFALGLAFVALLLIWKSSQSLIPPDPEIKGTSQARLAQRNLQSGYRDLLVRCIPYEELMPTCVREWKKSHTDKQQNQPEMKKTFQAIDKAMHETVPKSNRKQQAVVLYRNIQQIINRPAKPKP